MFRSDGTHNLITRLHHNVIRTGLRRINLAYSRISLADIAARLHLPSAEDAECIVAKAIRDGGIDAVIDHEGGFMASKEVRGGDKYTRKAREYMGVTMGVTNRSSEPYDQQTLKAKSDLASPDDLILDLPSRSTTYLPR